jgi:hypothetical protein
MAHLNLLRTVHCPVSADGRAVKNSFGVVIATALDSMTATAMAELINLAVPAAEKQEQERQEREDRLSTALYIDMVRNSPR